MIVQKINLLLYFVVPLEIACFVTSIVVVNVIYI